jgi:nucleoside-diphosphate-sugar epimerase
MSKGVAAVVTGSSGFLGSHLVRKLASSNIEVTEIDLKKGVDVTNWAQVKDLVNFSIVYHLAGKTYVPSAFREPRDFYFVNTVGTLNSLELCRRQRAKIVFISSYVYGVPQYLPIDEKHPCHATNPFSES